MLNNHLQTWRDAWIHHPLRTEQNKTPMQLWIGGLHFTQFGQRMLQDAQEPITQEEIDQYGIDWNGPVGTNQDNIVQVPDTTCPLDDHNLTLLKQAVDFRIDDGHYGISLYNDTMAEVTRLLEVQCSLPYDYMMYYSQAKTAFNKIPPTKTRAKPDLKLKELCHDILSHFCELQNHLQTEESLKLIVY
ncbi:hypothetical protein OS493_007213 [Desmophyllum pertusum]|uniref:Integrase core domain-containing protein n=1 Tax=Desmophyllum pertusum TaxID=174260 RepID=A0A9W9ZFK2_9CNID|nr:hypothetical protein OS493_007213 [Desmophyllum pertusum]